MRRPKARQDWVILQDKDTKSRIIVPDIGNLKMEGAKVVIAVGPGRYSDAGTLIPMQTQIGEEVMFTGGAEPKKVDGQVYWFLRDDHVQAAVEDDGEPVPAEASGLVLQ